MQKRIKRYIAPLLIAPIGYILLLGYLYYDYIEHNRDVAEIIQHLTETHIADILMHGMIFLAPVISTIIAILFQKILTESQKSEEHYRRLFQQSPLGVFHYDANLLLTDCNDRFTDILQSPRERLVGLDMKTLKDQSVLPAIRVALAGEEGAYEGFYRATTSPAEIWISMLTAPLFDNKDAIKGGVGLVEDITYRKLAEKALEERINLAIFTADIGASITQKGNLQDILLRCTEAMVRRLNAAFARIWTLNKEDNMLELQASAGMYTHIDGGHSRVPVGKFKIGLIAEERKPHLTNSVIGDPRVGEQEWAKREGMVAFAGYPLTIENRIVGVMAMFSRQPLSKTVLEALAAVANEIAIGIEHKKSEKGLNEKVEELEKFYEMAIGRELKMKELKEELARLKAELSEYRR
ncbi:MAG: GAF domain-containing protein [Nitrospirae bacterium]|nr:GAF domain-containing protein [Nitrospirota bacterium]